jgi:hypothetical protein
MKILIFGDVRRRYLGYPGDRESKFLRNVCNVLPQGHIPGNSNRIRFKGVI